MRVFILSDFAYVNGGASQIALNTALSLAQRGVRTSLFTGMGPVAENLVDQKFLSVICTGQYDILSDPNRFRAIYQGLWNHKAARILSHMLRDFSTHDTIVHVHTCQKVLSSSCIYAAKKLGFKVIYHLHDYGVACPNLGFYNYQTRQVCHYDPMSRSCLLSNCDARKYTHKVWRLLRQLVQKNLGGLPAWVDAFFAVSEFSHNILRPFLPKDSIVQVLQNPYRISSYPPVEVEKNKYFLFLGRMSAEKNPMEFAECARDLNLPALFVGNGEYLDTVKSIYPQAVFTGWLRKEQLYDYIRQVRCLVFPSAWYETQGLSVQEMAAYGIPAIVSDACAAKEMIINGNNGWIYESGNKDSLKDCLLRMIDDIDVSLMGKRAHELVKKKSISDEQYMEQLLSFYERVLLTV